LQGQRFPKGPAQVLQSRHPMQGQRFLNGPSEAAYKIIDLQNR
jgi:hypothetical protein